VPDDASKIAAALGEATRHLNADEDVPAALSAIVEIARYYLAQIDHVGISVAHRRGKIETLAATGPLVLELDQAQYDLREGPCVDAIESEPVVVVNELRHEQRWPRYVPRAAELGVRSQVGLRLYAEETLGGLNLYSTSSDLVTPETRQLADLFAAHASLALAQVRREDDMSTALASRRLIGQAIGIVMERYHITEDRAFQFLVRASSHGNIKMRDVAAELVREGNDKS